MSVRVFPFAATLFVLLTASACGGANASDITEDPPATAAGTESTQSLTATSEDAGANCGHDKKGDERGQKGKHGGKGHGHGHGPDGGARRGHPGPGDNDNDGDDRGHDDGPPVR